MSQIEKSNRSGKGNNRVQRTRPRPGIKKIRLRTDHESLAQRVIILSGEIHIPCPRCDWLGGGYSTEENAIISLRRHIKEVHLNR